MSQQNSQTPRDFLHALQIKFNVRITFDLACTMLDCVVPIFSPDDVEDVASLTVPVGYHFDNGQDALKEDWTKIPEPRFKDGKESVGWLNPPWKQTFRFAAKCNAHSKGRFILRPEREGEDPVDYEFDPGIRVFSLFPAGVGTNWFRQYVHGQADVYFLSPRLVYIDPRTGEPFVKMIKKDDGQLHPWRDQYGKTRSQTGLNDAILCDWSGTGETFCWNWKETLQQHETSTTR